MNIYATTQAKEAWNSLYAKERARTLAATYFAPSKLNIINGSPDSEYKKKGMNAIIHAAELQDYYIYWQRFVSSLPQEEHHTIDATLQTRLLVNLTGSILENAGISMEFICGVPIIPGSAVKGAARRYAIDLMQECEEAEKEHLLDLFIKIFGCVEVDFEKGSDLSLIFDTETLNEIGKLYKKRCGLVNFLQAVPKTKVNLCADILTPHHKNYMEGTKESPTDDEEPSPSFFPAVKEGSVYSFTLYAPGHQELLETAEEWLGKAITLYGIGAKGAAGYGYFSIVNKALKGYTAEEIEAIQFIEKKEKLDKMMATFHKTKDKNPLQHWALLRAICLPESESTCRLKDFNDFLTKAPSDPKGKKAKKKALEAMQEMATEFNFNFPNIS